MRTKTRARLSTVRFKCFSYDAWPITVVGSIRELGNWDPQAGLPMKLETEINGCREWVASIKCPVDQAIEFKFVANASEYPFWEVGENRMCLATDRWIEIADGFRG